MNLLNRKATSFSIRSLLFVTFVIGVFLAAFRHPSDEMVLCILATLIASVTVAWCVIVRDWHADNHWLLPFAIAATLLALDLYLVPSGWQNSVFAIVHPEDAAEHARSALSGINKEGEAFGAIFVDGVVLILAVCTATFVSILRPRRIPISLICIWILTASAGLFLVYDAIAFAVSVANVIVLTAAWYVVLRNPQNPGLVLIAFTLAVSCFMLFTHARMLPELNLYAVLHVPPASNSDLHQQRYVFETIYRDCVSLWFGGIVALSIGGLARIRPFPLDNATNKKYY